MIAHGTGAQPNFAFPPESEIHLRKHTPLEIHRKLIAKAYDACTSSSKSHRAALKPRARERSKSMDIPLGPTPKAAQDAAVYMAAWKAKYGWSVREMYAIDMMSATYDPIAGKTADDYVKEFLYWRDDYDKGA